MSAVDVSEIPIRLWLFLSTADQRLLLLIQDAGKGRFTEEEFVKRYNDLQTLRRLGL
jgi:hypothetical protein